MKATITRRVNIESYNKFFEVMKAEGFFRWAVGIRKVEDLLATLSEGENWFTNGAIEFKIIHSSNEAEPDVFLNFRSIVSSVIEDLADAAE